MNSYASFSANKGPTKWLLWLLVFIFLTTLTTFTILEVQSLNSEEPSVIRIILNNLKSTNEAESLTGGVEDNNNRNRFVLVNVKDIHQTEDELVKEIVTKVETEENTTDLQRNVRAADVQNVTEVNVKKNSYYEEQTPVVIYSKTDEVAPLSYRQEAPIPYQQGSHEEQPYYNGDNDDVNGDYANDEETYYRPQYDDDSREDFEGPQSYNEQQDSPEGRSSQNRQYDAYYRQWHYATPPPTSAHSADTSKASSSSSYTLSASAKGNRKLPDMTAPATGGPR